MAASVASAQEVRQLSIRGLRIDASGDLGVFLALQDGQGKPVTSPQTSQFKLEIDGKSVEGLNYEATPFSKSGEGRGVLFGVDVSGSMASSMTGVANSLSQYLLSMRPSLDRVGIGQIGSEWKIIQEFSSDQQVLKKSLESLKANDFGTTALFESIHLGIQFLHKPSSTQLPVRRSMIVVTDGLNEKAGRTAGECADLAKKDLVQVHSLLFLPKPNARLLSAKGELEKISRDSGGITVTASDPKEIGDFFLQVQKEIDSEILLKITGAALPRDGTEHALTLRYLQSADSAKYVAIEGHRAAPDTSLSKNSCKVGEDGSEKDCPSVTDPKKDENSILLILIAAGVVLTGAGLLLFRRAKRETEAADPMIQTESNPDPSGLQVRDEMAALKSEIEINSPQEAVNNTRSRKTEYRPPVAETEHRFAVRVVEGECSGFYAIIPNGGTRIGRDPSNGVVIPSDSVSGSHAEVFQDVSGRLLIRNLSASNGTFINGVRMSSEPESFVNGMKIRMGAVILVVEKI